MKTNQTKRKQLLNDLEEHLLTGGRISVKQLIESNFDTSSKSALMLADKVVRSWVASLKRTLKIKHGLWLGNIDDNGNYGVVETEEEARYAGFNYYRLIKGNLNSTQRLIKESQSKGLLPRVENQKVLLPYVTVKELNENKTKSN